MKQRITIKSHSEEETFKLGQFIGKELKSGHVLALIGDLGAGKTCLSRGIGSGLGLAKNHHIHSPAFDLIHEHPGPIPMYHMDFYRLDYFSPEDELWVNEYVYAKAGVCVIEWADKFILSILEHYLKIQLTMCDDNDTIRSIDFLALGSSYHSLIDSLYIKYSHECNPNCR